LDSHADLAIEASGLVKTFGETRAVGGVDLAVRPGMVYGLLGPNGAGKTTTIRMLATLLPPDSGTARVFGHNVVRDADAVRSRVSLTGQFASVDEDLTGFENLVLLARLLGYSRAQAKARAGELLEAFGLSEAADRQVKNYSGGMQRRLDIAASIVVTPDLMFLDEPTAGLDPRSRHQVWEIVRALVAGGTNRPRQSHRRGHQRRAQGLGRLGYPAHPAARPSRPGRGRAGALAGARRARAARL
jgi:ABC-2 type transport system ATP-binding protein